MLWKSLLAPIGALFLSGLVLSWGGCADGTTDLPDAGDQDAVDGEPDGAAADGDDPAPDGDVGPGDEPGDPGGDPGGDEGGDSIGDEGGDPGGDEGGDPGGDEGGDPGGDEGGDPTADGGGDQGGDQGCTGSQAFDYSCTAGEPETCPGGMCLLGMCIAPVLDETRWDDCGDDSCDTCETAQDCPADCGTWPGFTGNKEYDNATTITVWVHGFYNKSPGDIDTMVYGAADGCGGVMTEFETYGVIRPCGESSPGDTAPDQRVEVEYYGAIPAAWLSQADVDEIEQYPYEGKDALHRYALIVAKFIRHRLGLSGASHVNLGCHSMGCLITRHLIEHDLEGLASENRLVRWFSSAGVIAGARLARLYDNPDVQNAAPAIGLELTDFVIMHPDFVQDHTCVWDHKLYEGNTPYLKDMIIHHATATDPHISEALGIALLDLNNPGDEPNDGIMYTQDEYFHSMADDVVFHNPGGIPLQPSRNAVYVDHMTLPNTDAAGLLATANLFHSRKVRLSLAEVELKKDRENHEFLDGETGLPPAEIIAEAEIRYNPYVLSTFGQDVLVHHTELEHRSPEMFTQDEGTISQPGYVLFYGPVFDAMTDLHLKFLLLEVDWYKRMGVFEYFFNHHELLIGFDGQVPLVDDTIVLDNEYVRANLQVEVFDLY